MLAHNEMTQFFPLHVSNETHNLILPAYAVSEFDLLFILVPKTLNFAGENGYVTAIKSMLSSCIGFPNYIGLPNVEGAEYRLVTAAFFETYVPNDANSKETGLTTFCSEEFGLKDHVLLEFFSKQEAGKSCKVWSIFSTKKTGEKSYLGQVVRERETNSHYLVIAENSSFIFLSPIDLLEGCEESQNQLSYTRIPETDFLEGVLEEDRNVENLFDALDTFRDRLGIRFRHLRATKKDSELDLYEQSLTALIIEKFGIESLMEQYPRFRLISSAGSRDNSDNWLVNAIHAMEEDLVGKVDDNEFLEIVDGETRLKVPYARITSGHGSELFEPGALKTLLDQKRPV